MKTRLTILLMVLYANVFAQNAFQKAVMYEKFRLENAQSLANFEKNKKQWMSILDTAFCVNTGNICKFIAKPLQNNDENIDLAAFVAKAYAFDNFDYRYYSDKRQIDSMNTVRASKGLGMLAYPVRVGAIQPQSTTTQSTVLQGASMPSSYEKILSSPLTAAVDATAKFLVQRTKEELAIAFFDRFRAEIAQNKLLEYTFPKTYTLLRYQDYFSAPSMGNTWTSAFEDDLGNVPLNIDAYINAIHPEYLTAAEATMFSVTVNVINESKENPSVNSLINFLDNKYAFGSEKYNNQVVTGVKILNILNNNLLNKETDEYILLTEYVSLGKVGRQYFWSILFNDNQEFFNSIGKKELKDADIDDLYKFVKSLLNLRFDKVGDAADYSLKVNSYLSNCKSFIDLIDNAEEVVFLFQGKRNEFLNSNYYQNVRPLVKGVFDNFKYIQDKKYGFAALSSLKILEQFAKKDDKLANDEVFSKFAFYLNFVTDIISADDAVSYKIILDRYAMPTGSYRIKRKSSISVDLQAFPSVYFGNEILNKNNPQSAVYGISAPIGLSISAGNLNSLFSESKKGHSYSLFVPIIDIGAAFSYRFKNDDIEGLPEKIKWEQIFSPGIYGVWGFRNTPINLQLGAQFTPQLRQITTLGNVYYSNAIRYSLGVSVDIPILHFWHKK